MHLPRKFLASASAVALVGTVHLAPATAQTDAAEHAPMACDIQLPVQELTGAPAANENYTIAISVPSLANPYITALLYGASLAAEQAGVTLTISSGEGFMDPVPQIRQVENALTRQPDALLINPADPDALALTVDDAIAAGIPVFDVGTLTHSTLSYKVVQDDYVNGVMGAELLNTLLPEGGTGIVQGGPANATWARRQVAGFLDKLPDFPNLIVSTVTNSDLSPVLGLQEFENATRANPDVDFIFVTNNLALPPSAVPPEFEGAVYIAGSFDAGLRDAIAAGDVEGNIPYFPTMVGYYGVINAVTVLNGGNVPMVTCIPSAAITIDNVNDPIWEQTNMAPEGWQPPA